MSIRVYISQNIEQVDFFKSECEYYFSKLFQTEVCFVDKLNESVVVFDVVQSDEDIDWISIKLSNGVGFVKANSQISILIALYRLCKEFGVRFLRPGRKNEYIPKQSEKQFFSAEIHIDEYASFKHRGVCIEGADSYENIVHFIDWLPKIGMNSFFVQFENPYPFLKRWYVHEFNPYIEKEVFSNEIAQVMSDKIDIEMKKRGLCHHRVGHGWTGEVLGYSSKYGWESGLTLPEDKKELVAELDGHRELYDTAPILTSLDFSNPKVREKMVSLIVKYAKERRDVDYLHVWLSDARNNICECEQCQKELPSDQYVRILNSLDEALTKEGLDTKICFLLYHELLFAPQKEVLKNPNRFTMMFAPITRTFEKSYADVDYKNGIPEPKAYIRNQIVLPNSLEENISYLKNWQQQFKGDSFVYDYPLGRAHYGDFGYLKISKVISRDIKYLQKLKLNGYISCQELRVGFPHNFPNYIMGEMLWNKENDYETIKKDYFEHLYGQDFQLVLNYLEKLSTYSSCDYFNAIGDRINPSLSHRYKVVVNLADEQLALIEKNCAVATGIQKNQWIQLSYHRAYVKKIAQALSLLAEGRVYQAQETWRDFLDFIRRNEVAIQENLDVYRVIEVAKNYAGFVL